MLIKQLYKLKIAVTFFRGISLPLIIFFMIIIIGVIGLIFLENINLGRAILWVIVVDAIQFSSVSKSTELFILAIRIGLVISGLWVGQKVVTSLFRGEIQEVWRKMRNFEKIGKLSDHYIICGYGKFGKEIGESLIKAGEKVLIIELDDNIITTLRDRRIPVVRYDIIESKALEEAKIKKAKCLIAAVDDSVKNLCVTLNAKALNPNIYIITRTDTDQYKELAEKAGANEIIMPEIEAGKDVFNRLIQRKSQ